MSDTSESADSAKTTSFYISIHGDGVDGAHTTGDSARVASLLGRVVAEAGSIHADIEIFEDRRGTFSLLFHCLDGACPTEAFMSVDESLRLLTRVLETKGADVDVVEVGQTFDGSGIPVPDVDPSWDQL